MMYIASIAIQTFSEISMGQRLPITILTTRKTIATKDDTRADVLKRFMITPRITANRMNEIDAVAAIPFVSFSVSVPPIPSNVPATMDVNAAMTSTSVKNANTMKSLLDFGPIVLEMTSPMD